MELEKKEERREKEETENKPEEFYRLSVSKGAEKALIALVGRVNDGFQGGRVTRTQVANWILVKSEQEFGETEVRKIRAEHFDEVAMLEAVLRQAKANGKLPEELRGILQKQLGFEDQGKRRSKKTVDG